MDWDNLLRRCRPDVILPLSPDNELQLAARGIDVDVERMVREQQISQQLLQLEKWDEDNLAAMSYIVKHLGPSELTHVTDCTTAAEMWEALKKFYMVQGAIEIANTEALLSAIIQTEAEDLNVYVKRLQQLHQDLKNLGAPVTPMKQAINLLNSLNTHYSPMVSTLMPWSESSPHLFTIPHIVSALLRDDVRKELNERKRGALPGGHQAHYGGPRGGSGAGGSNRPGGGGGAGRRDAAGVECFGCHQFGHIRANCPSPAIGGGHAGASKCHRCHQAGHRAAQCPAPSPAAAHVVHATQGS